MGGTEPGTQQALHKYLKNERVTQCAFPELLPQTVSAVLGGGQACREDHLAAWGACPGHAEEPERGGRCAALGSGRKHWRTVSCLDYGCFN